MVVFVDDVDDAVDESGPGLLGCVLSDVDDDDAVHLMTPAIHSSPHGTESLSSYLWILCF